MRQKLRKIRRRMAAAAVAAVFFAVFFEGGMALGSGEEEKLKWSVGRKGPEIETPEKLEEDFRSKERDLRQAIRRARADGDVGMMKELQGQLRAVRRGRWSGDREEIKERRMTQREIRESRRAARAEGRHVRTQQA